MAEADALVAAEAGEADALVAVDEVGGWSSSEEDDDKLAIHVQLLR